MSFFPLNLKRLLGSELSEIDEKGRAGWIAWIT
jgi:hypothetical protein